MRNTKNLCNTLLFVLILAAMIFLPKKAYASEKVIYQDGIYRYEITDEEKKEVLLLDIDSIQPMKEVSIPGKALINGTEYTVSNVHIRFERNREEAQQEFYRSVEKLIIMDNFSGVFIDPIHEFKNLRTVEFLGTSILPEKINLSIYNSNEHLDILFLVPNGYEKSYETIIDIYMHYDASSDLYEQDIPMQPTIANKEEDAEYKCFAVDDFIYQVTKSAKGGKGNVQLIGIRKINYENYLKLPAQVENEGYIYELTKICRFSLIDCQASVLVIPDTVTEMDSGSIDFNVELLFLSKNCKVIPSVLVAEENSESKLRFVYIPEGVTTISRSAFYFHNRNQCSVILPSTIKSIDKDSFYGVQLVTFLNKKPIDNIASAIQKGTTVKVDSSAISAYKKQIGKKATLTAAKKIVKSTELVTSISSIKLDTSKTYSLKATLTKGSNETVYWLSTNTKVFDVSSKGVINPKREGFGYVVAYTRTSGLHKIIKVTVTNKFFSQGIFTYRISDVKNRTVTLCSIQPKSTTTRINIPEKITYNNKSYTVTGVLANDNKISATGFPDDSKNILTPLISDAYKENNITDIIFPKSIEGTVGYLGFMPNIKNITFKGTKAPDAIVHWYNDGGLLAFQAVIHVPAKSTDYKYALRTSGNYDDYYTINYGCTLEFNVLEEGKKQVNQFAVDGILYKVTKKAGTENGKVTVQGADINLKEINVGGIVKNGKYSYEVTEIKNWAFYCSNAKKIVIGDSITKIGNKAFNEKVEYLKWSKNCKTISNLAFTPSWDITKLPYEEEMKYTSKSDFYSLNTFIIPYGVTKIKGPIFDQGFGNLKSITVPKSVTFIDEEALKNIPEIIYQ